MFNIYTENTMSNDNEYFSSQNILEVLKNTSNKIPLFLVDDDKDDRYQATSVLSKSESISNIFQFDSAADLFLCFDSIGLYEEDNAEHFSGVILLDIHMPDINGMETLRYIRDHPITAHMNVILLSTDLSCEKIHEAYELEVDGYLEKPLNLNSFHELLRSDSAWVTAP